MQLPATLKSGRPARLFPDLAVSNRENRMTSIFLALVPQIPELASAIFGSVGQRIGKRTSIRAWTEVTFQQGGSGGDQPDGYVEITSGSKVWTALIEAKVGRNNLDQEQVKRYVELARDNAIDAVITISNEFVTQANQSPVSIPGTMLRRTSLFHWSWTWIATQCELLQAQMAVDDKEQAFLLSEFKLFLNSDGAGVERFTQMGAGWKSLVQDATHQNGLKRSSPEVSEGLDAWFKEEKDLCLQLSSLVGHNVTTVIERRHRDDPKARLKDGITRLVDNQQLATKYRIPNAAGDLEVTADLARRTLCASIGLRAPTDKVKTKSRVNWLLRMLKKDHDNLYVRAHWPGRAQPTAASIKELREAPERIQCENENLAPHSFEIFMLLSNGQRFAGRRTFIEDLEKLVPEFYSTAVYHLRAWAPPPLKPRVATSADDTEADEPSDAGPVSELEGQVPRPEDQVPDA